MGRLPLISESLRCLGLSDEHKESLEQYLRGFVNDKRSAGSDNVGSALLVNEALIGFRDEYDKGGASWAAQVLNKVMKDSDNTRRHLGNIVKAQVKRREYYDKEKSGTRVPKSHANSNSPEDYNDFGSESSWRPSSMTPQQPTTGHPYGTRGVMQGGKSDCASKNAKGDDPDTIDVYMQGSIPPEEPRGPALGPATATNHVVGGTHTGDRVPVRDTASARVAASPVRDIEDDEPFLQPYTYFDHRFSIDDAVAAQLLRAVLASHETLTDEMMQKRKACKSQQGTQRANYIGQQAILARLQAMFDTDIRIQTS